MKFRKPLLFLMASINFLQLSAQTDYEIRTAQNSYVKDYS